MRLSGKICLVTGGGRGIGRGIALGFANEGATVIVCSRSQLEIDSVACQIEKIGQKSMAIKTDVTSEFEVGRLVTEVIKEFGKIDILVNNAGIGEQSFILNSSYDSFKKTIDTNLNGVFLCSKSVIPSMLEHRFGRIINISSVGAFKAIPGFSAYSASKAAVLALTKTLAAELGETGITVNAIVPGPVMTDMFTEGMKNLSLVTNISTDNLIKGAEQSTFLKRLVKIEEVVKTVLFIASNDSSGITGASVAVSGGND